MPLEIDVWWYWFFFSLPGTHFQVNFIVDISSAFRLNATIKINEFFATVQMIAIDRLEMRKNVFRFIFFVLFLFITVFEWVIHKQTAMKHLRCHKSVDQNDGKRKHMCDSLHVFCICNSCTCFICLRYIYCLTISNLLLHFLAFIQQFTYLIFKLIYFCLSFN